MTKAPIRALLAISLSSALFPLLAHGATADTVVIVLQDSSDDPSISGMVMKTDTSTVKTGRVTLEAFNQSKSLVHEVLIVPAPPDAKEFAYDKKQNIVIERRVHPLGEIPDLSPGARGRLTLTLKPGEYVLLCNQPGHYKAGMSAKLVVEK